MLQSHIISTEEDIFLETPGTDAIDNEISDNESLSHEYLMNRFFQDTEYKLQAKGCFEFNLESSNSQSDISESRNVVKVQKHKESEIIDDDLKIEKMYKAISKYDSKDFNKRFKIRKINQKTKRRRYNTHQFFKSASLVKAEMMKSTYLERLSLESFVTTAFSRMIKDIEELTSVKSVYQMAYPLILEEMIDKETTRSKNINYRSIEPSNFHTNRALNLAFISIKGNPRSDQILDTRDIKRSCQIEEFEYLKRRNLKLGKQFAIRKQL